VYDAFYIIAKTNFLQIDEIYQVEAFTNAFLQQWLARELGLEDTVTALIYYSVDGGDAISVRQTGDTSTVLLRYNTIINRDDNDNDTLRCMWLESIEMALESDSYMDGLIEAVRGSQFETTVAIEAVTDCTMSPSAAPTISFQPSPKPSVTFEPSHQPSSSPMPSHQPTVSFQPSVSSSPSQTPTIAPTWLTYTNTNSTTGEPICAMAGSGMNALADGVGCNGLLAAASVCFRLAADYNFVDPGVVVKRARIWFAEDLFGIPPANRNPQDMNLELLITEGTKRGGPDFTNILYMLPQPPAPVDPNQPPVINGNPPLEITIPGGGLNILYSARPQPTPLDQICVSVRSVDTGASLSIQTDRSSTTGMQNDFSFLSGQPACTGILPNPVSFPDLIQTRPFLFPPLGAAAYPLCIAVEVEQLV